MQRISNPGEEPRDPVPDPGDDVREPPLPGDHGRERCPGIDEVPDPRGPDEGGGSIKKRVSQRPAADSAA